MKPEDDPTIRWFTTPTDRARAEEQEDEDLLRALTSHESASQSQADELAAVREYLLSGSPPQELVRLLLPPTRRATGEDWRVAKALARDWHHLGFTIDAVRDWLVAGVEIDETSLVRSLLVEGLGPEHLTRVVAHPYTGERVTVLDVARTAQMHWDSLCAALDDIGIERVREPLRFRWFA